ncbi:uncharacterized protein LOC113279048 [Papaver somniferum]|uniref:uncharacterized protein LOC113279048 n=1 Tax=Papaver somniferum TaxID=3469 RepID=UPI000E705A70|nr:uncharacterized protein LOC113279048 [Papaver somniferum]
MFKPSSDSEAFYLARLQQASLDSQSKRYKTFPRQFQPSTSSFSPSSNFKASLPPLTNIPKPSFSPDKPIITHPLTPTKPEPTLPPIKRLTPAQMQAIRDKALCYNCDVFYKPGHRCKTQQLFMLVASEDDNASPPIEDSEEENGSPSTSGDTTMEISLHALTGLVTQNTIRVPGKLLNQDIFVLIDTGSTHSFLDSSLAEKLHLHIAPTGQMLVTVANGDTTVSHGVCPNLHWSMQGYKFDSDLRVLPLGGCDMVLGVDWLKGLGDVVFNLADLKVSFQHQGAHITLQGHKDRPSCNLLSGASFLKFVKTHTSVIIGHFFSISAAPIAPPPPEITSILHSYDDVFNSPSTLCPTRVIDHKIPLKPNSTPTSQRLYRCPYIQKAVVEQLAQEMLDAGLIQDSTSPFAAPILLVKKKDGSWRFCVDYIKLNEMTIKDKFPIPLIEELLDELNGATIFTKLDLKAGYHQIRMHIEDIYKTAFRTHHGHYEFKVMPFGLTNAPATFQSLMNTVFQPFIRKFVLLNYFGHIISSRGVAADPEKLVAMQTWPQPKNLKQLRGFLGLTGYYKRFIQGYGNISKPLTDMLKKNSFVWSPFAIQAFQDLKDAMTTTPVLALPDFSSPFVLETDACTRGGCKPLGPKALALSIYGKELLAIVMDVQKWRHYLSHNQFIINKDQSLKFFMEQRMSSILQQKWLMKLLGLDYVIHYKKKGGILRYKNRMYVGAGNNMRTSIMQSVHASAVGGHSGILAGLLQPLPIPDAAWQHISMDFIEGFPLSNRKSVILVVVDRLTRYSHFIALSHPFTTASVAKEFMHHVFKIHGLPSSIVSDRDKIFISQFWQELFKSLGISLHLSTAYHPQSDGQTERTNACLEQYLRCMTGTKPKLWANWLSLAEWWFNTNFHTSLKMTPFQALYGYLPPHLAFHVHSTTTVASVQEYLQERDHMLQLLKDDLLKAQYRMKFYDDISRCDRYFNVGDWVFLKLQPYRQSSVALRQNLKLSAKYYGPFEVLQKVGTVAYKLKIPIGSRIHLVFHVSQLKKKIGQHRIPSTSLPLVDTSGDFIVLPVAVLDHRQSLTGGVAVQQVLIQWSNSQPEDATWEDISHIHAQFPEFILEDKNA